MLTVVVHQTANVVNTSAESFISHPVTVMLVSCQQPLKLSAALNFLLQTNMQTIVAILIDIYPNIVRGAL